MTSKVEVMTKINALIRAVRENERAYTLDREDLTETQDAVEAAKEALLSLLVKPQESGR